MQRRYVLHVRAAIDGLIGQVLTYHYLGQAEAAQESLALLFDFVHETNELTYVTLAESCKARLSILQDAATSSRNWLQTAD